MVMIPMKEPPQQSGTKMTNSTIYMNAERDRIMDMVQKWNLLGEQRKIVAREYHAACEKYAHSDVARNHLRVIRDASDFLDRCCSHGSCDLHPRCCSIETSSSGPMGTTLYKVLHNNDDPPLPEGWLTSFLTPYCETAHNILKQTELIEALEYMDWTINFLRTDKDHQCIHTCTTDPAYPYGKLYPALIFE